MPSLEVPRSQRQRAAADVTAPGGYHVPTVIANTQMFGVAPFAPEQRSASHKGAAPPLFLFLFAPTGVCVCRGHRAPARGTVARKSEHGAYDPRAFLWRASPPSACRRGPPRFLLLSFRL
jgi:hypothetical protein